VLAKHVTTIVPASNADPGTPREDQGHKTSEACQLHQVSHIWMHLFVQYFLLSSLISSLSLSSPPSSSDLRPRSQDLRSRQFGSRPSSTPNGQKGPCWTCRMRLSRPKRKDADGAIDVIVHYCSSPMISLSQKWCPREGSCLFEPVGVVSA
jgi:hypothetical protein